MANGRSKVDWPAAKAFFVGLPVGERTNRRVAAEFHVSEQSVGKHARAEGWLEAARQADDTRGRKLLDRAIRSREERGIELLRIADEVYDQISEQLLEKKLEVKLSDLPAIDRMVRLELGEATDRVSFEEMQAGFRTSITVAIEVAAAVAGELLDGQADRFVKVYRERFVAAVEGALGELTP